MNEIKVIKGVKIIEGGKTLLVRNEDGYVEKFTVSKVLKDRHTYAGLNGERMATITVSNEDGKSVTVRAVDANGKGKWFDVPRTKYRIRNGKRA
jgi:hypothetical protein